MADSSHAQHGTEIVNFVAAHLPSVVCCTFAAAQKRPAALLLLPLPRHVLKYDACKQGSHMPAVFMMEHFNQKSMPPEVSPQENRGLLENRRSQPLRALTIARHKEGQAVNRLPQLGISWRVGLWRRKL